MSNYEGRKFSKKDYDKDDAWGTEILRQVLIARGYELVPKEKEDYGIDIVGVRNGLPEFFEVEVKHNYPWTDREDFKFDTVSFLGRKRKWNDLNFWYCVICAETESIIFAQSSEIFKEDNRQLKQVNSQNRKGLDEFYMLPKEKCFFVSKQQLISGE
jgi:hypothetical protein